MLLVAPNESACPNGHNIGTRRAVTGSNASVKTGTTGATDLPAQVVAYPFFFAFFGLNSASHGA
jgi:hypothetical protein